VPAPITARKPPNSNKNTISLCREKFKSAKKAKKDVKKRGKYKIIEKAASGLEKGRK
jgi:hypothetical protein